MAAGRALSCALQLPGKPSIGPFRPRLRSACKNDRSLNLQQILLKPHGKLQQEKRTGERGGEGGIRTPGTVARTHDFQSCTFDHSVTSPGARTAAAVRLTPWDEGVEGKANPAAGQRKSWAPARAAALVNS